MFQLASLAKNIFTWDMLQSRGFVGPGICILCHANFEIVEHLFGDYSFTTSFRHMLVEYFHLSFIWEPNDLKESHLRWKDSFPFLMETPLATVWEVWHARNMVIFQDFNLREA